MNCQFLRIGSHEPCNRKPTKHSNYCYIHNYLIKKSNAKPCIKCTKGTTARDQICCACDNIKANVLERYYTKISKAKCLRCDKRTAAKDQICCACDNTKAQMLERYHNVYKEYKKESYRLRQILIN